MPKLSEIKSWSLDLEKSITKKWKKSNQFAFNPKTKKKIYSIDTPPPYVNTPIHIGHAITYCYMDFFARYKRMKGYEVLFPLGLDRNGLPIEMAAEKKFKIDPIKVGRKKFVEYCEKLLAKSSEESIDSFARLGISFNSYKKGKNLGEIYHTDSPEYRTLTQNTFIDLFKKELVYEDNRVNNWDPKLQTTIADSEIEYKEIQSNFNDIKWKVKETGEEIIIATTRPELICTCGYIIFNPKDKRYKKLEGKTAITPLYDKEIPILSNSMAQEEKGTGIMMICGGGDLMDNQFFRDKGESPLIAINKDGTMNEHSGFLKGLKVREAREKILYKLKEKGLLVKQTKFSHRTPISERSGVEIEFIKMPEFYLNQLSHLNKVRSISNEINFFPKESKKILDTWIDSISIDWPISRRRFYATPIPLWRSEKEDLIAIPPKGKYYQPWKEPVPLDSDIYQLGQHDIKGKVKDVKFKNIKWIGEEKVFDTWFDSSISELNIIKYPSKFSKNAYPASLRPQGKEIVRTWLYYTLLRGYLETKKPAFKDIWIHQHILDAKGRKMSKSLGNIIDPKDILNEEGSEALRFWSAIEGNLASQDLSCNRIKIKSEQKTLNKLLNISKFISQFKKPKIKPQLTKLDKMFIDYVEELTQFCDVYYNEYNFNKPALRLRKFLWEKFASHYIELVKARAYNESSVFTKSEQESAQYTLHFILERLLILLYPIIPQVTSTILSSLKVKIDKFPKPGNIKSELIDVERLMDFNSKVWKAKRDKNLSLRDPIKRMKIPTSLKQYQADLKACHNLE